MDLGSINSQKVLGYESIRELKVPLKQAIEATKKDGLDEVFFNAGGKDYVAYGKGMDLKSLQGIPATFNNKEVNITHIDNEKNSGSEGAKDAFKHIPGQITIGTGAIVGIAAGFKSAAFKDILGFIVGAATSPGKQLAIIGIGVAVGLGVGAGLTAGGGAIVGAAKGTDYEPLKEICK